MIFDGIKFRINRNIVMLQRSDGVNVRFGRIVPEGKPVPPNAEATNYTWGVGYPVLAVPIESQGYSRTNMMYGKDGRIYLGYDGRCYTAKMRRKSCK
jgi:hypothetical protein